MITTVFIYAAAEFQREVVLKGSYDILRKLCTSKNDFLSCDHVKIYKKKKKENPESGRPLVPSVCESTFVYLLCPNYYVVLQVCSQIIITA